MKSIFALLLAMVWTHLAQAALSVTTASVQPQVVMTNGTIHLSTTITTSAALSNVNIDLEIRDAANTPKNIQKTYTNVSLRAGESKVFTMNYLIPANMKGQDYCFTVGVFNSAWNQTLLWKTCAAPFKVVSIPRLKGVNLSGAEFGTVPGTLNVNYTFPTHGEVDYYVKNKVNVFRLPFLWERVQPTLNGSLDSAYLGHIQDFVTYATSKGAYVLLDLHNFGRYLGKDVGSATVPNSAFANVWSRLATVFKSNPQVIFDLMNEPFSQSATQVVQFANAAIAAIRSTGASNMIFYEGTSWTGAATWITSGNAAAVANLVDPLNNIVFEVHQYLDSDSSGTHSTCVSSTIGRQRLAAVTAWAKQNNKKLFLGEFAFANNATCLAAGQDTLTSMESNSDVWFGWTYWGGGPWWGTYMFALDPVNGVDSPMMTILKLFF